jgi:3-hydroxybutyryl-CoA dehydrogenase
MGVGVAQALAQTGHHVLLIDVADEILERAEREIAENVRLHHLLKLDAGRQDPAEVMPRIRFSTDHGLLAESEFVIENVTEDWDLKRSVYGDLDRICDKHCVFGANTSAIPITWIGSITTRESRVIGLHFMNPAQLTPAVEVVRGPQTSDETIGTALMLLAQMNKEAILVQDSPGFVSNRVMMLSINEAAFLLVEGVAASEDIDRIFKRCFAHAMGPLETADLIGLDTVLRSLEVLHGAFGGDKYEPCPLLRSMVDEGSLGRKSGRGFYAYGVSDEAQITRGHGIVYGNR